MRGLYSIARILAVGCLWFGCGYGSVLLRAQITGGMLNPDVDLPREPFSYFWHPTDVIGALYAPVATEVTPEGYLYTGFGELMFFEGNPPEPVNQRIKTLYHGYLPIVQYHLRRDGLRYSLTMFAADLGKGLQGLPVNFVEVELRNEGKEARAAYLSSAYRFSTPINGLGGVADYRFAQRLELMPQRYTEGQMAFNPGWKYAFGPNSLVRDGRVLYWFPTQPKPEQETLSLRDNGLRMYRYFTGEVEGSHDPKYVLDSHTPMGVVAYRVVLKPGESRSLVFKMPIVPLPEGTAEAKQVGEAEYQPNFERTVSFWEGLVGKSPPLRFPEAKVQETMLANTVYDLLAIDKIGDDYITNDNKFQYHDFQGGCDTNHMNLALDYLGLQEIAQEALLYSVSQQSPDGSWVLPEETARGVPHQYWETFGCTLWSWGRHYLLTRDSSFLQQIYPAVVRAMDWEMQITQKDPLGLMPPASIPDDAWLKGAHQTGQDIWTLVGLRNAVVLAEAMGKREDLERFRAENQRFRRAFEKQLAMQTAKTGGYIPPALDLTLLGNNWDNLLTLYPEPLFDPFDPRVTATIRESRKTYAEGVLGYVLPRANAQKDANFTFDSARRLIYWQTPDDAENGLVRGDPEDQEWAIEDLYGLLLHTTSTHSAQEFGTYPWSDRDFVDDDLPPDGPASGGMIELMRNMLVREYQNDLFLFSAVSPAWLQAGKRIEITNEPTVFGPVTAVLVVSSDHLEVSLSNHFRQAPEHVVITLPWFYEVRQAVVDGRPVQAKKGKLILSPSVHSVRVMGRLRPRRPEMSFERAVENYKREYKRRYGEFLRTGMTNPK